MAYSLGLTLYNLGARKGAQPVRDRPARPAGRLVWLHAPDAESLGGLAELARRLGEEDGHPVLLTSPDPAPTRPGLIWQPPPADTSAEAKVFLDHWRPDCAVFAGGEVRPALLHEAIERHLPLAMANARAPFIAGGREGWFPGLLRGLLGHVPTVLAMDDGAARALRRAGCPPAAVEVTGRMEEASAALPCTEAERAALARLLATRPVWLAAALPEAEETAAIEAHRAGLRLAHRLLLIVVVADPARADALADRMATDEGWTVARRAADEEPDAETEVYIADQSELGLWYRLAPITFLGGSLAGTGCLRNPMEAAALGSAIIHGPRPGAHGIMFGRLGAVRAARSVATSADLGEALGDLLSPDRAARLAQAAWSVVSDGAEVTERVLTLIRKMLGED